jgi:hypothetical protein
VNIISDKRPRIFISYSHFDSGFVGPVVTLLRASDALIFRDADEIQPGKKWRKQIENAITNSRTVVVFWCCHSNISEEVKREYEAAIEQQKKVLPILMDNTPLPDDLTEYQHIDFRAVFAHVHTARPQGVNATLQGQFTAKRLWTMVTCVLALVVAILITQSIMLRRHRHPALISHYILTPSFR